MVYNGRIFTPTWAATSIGVLAMALIANRKSVMTLFTGDTDIDSHRVRIVLAEKGINVELHYVEAHELPEDLIEMNPYGTVPTLIDRDLVLYSAQVIMEYLDERFPHPPLMPVDPVSRARSRLMLYRIEKDWYRMVDKMLSENEAEVAQARMELRDSLAVLAPLFEQKPFFMSDELSLVDCAIAPLLWRLPSYGIELPTQSKSVYQYAERIFERESFQSSLSDIERELGQKVA